MGVGGFLSVGGTEEEETQKARPVREGAAKEADGSLVHESQSPALGMLHHLNGQFHGSAGHPGLFISDWRHLLGRYKASGGSSAFCPERTSKPSSVVKTRPPGLQPWVLGVTSILTLVPSEDM